MTMTTFEFDHKIEKANGYPHIDTREGIAGFLGSLEGFKRLVALRREACYGNGARLNTWYILGRWSLDGCGNCMKAGEFIPAEKIWDCPDVCTSEELFAEIRKYDFARNSDVLTREEMDADDFDWSGNKRPYPTSVSFGMGSGSSPAPSDLVCSQCMKGWTLENCHDIHVSDKTDVIPAGEFIGKTAVDLEGHLNNGTETKRYRIQRESGLRNDKYIDLTLVENNIWKKEDNHVKNEKGWMKFDPETHILEEGDEVHFYEWTFSHAVCYQDHLDAEVKAEFKKAMNDAEFDFGKIDDVKNEYGSGSYRGQWHVFQTMIGKIRIGWRSRVIEIDWSDIGEDFEHLFPDEDVTKSSSIIHAYSLDKLTEYLKKINDYMAETV